MLGERLKWPITWIPAMRIRWSFWNGFGTKRLRPVKEPTAVSYTDPDVLNFWDDGALEADQYVSAPPTDELIESVEEALVFKRQHLIFKQ